jgi:hypothetical protein
MAFAKKQRRGAPLPGDTFPPVRNTDPAASHAGAAMIMPHVGKLQRMVLRVFLGAGPMGATNEDVYHAYSSLQEHSLRPRVNELHQKGFVEMIGRRRGSHGVDITVWRATAQAHEWARQHPDDFDPAP